MGYFPETTFGHAEATGPSKDFLVASTFDRTVFDSSHSGRLYTKNLFNTTGGFPRQELGGFHAADLSGTFVGAAMAHILGTAHDFAGFGDFDAAGERAHTFAFGCFHSLSPFLGWI